MGEQGGLDRDQLGAFHKCTRMFRHGNPNCTVILGPPGTGKTKTIGAVVKWAVSNAIGVVVACPTGRAAVNISESLSGNIQASAPCMTVDKLIMDIRYKKKASLAPLFTMAEAVGGMVVIDEVGMLSKRHYEDLVVAGLINRHNIKLVLCGDCDQLPPPASKPFYAHPLFLDKIRDGMVNYAVLRTNHRNGRCSKLSELLQPFKTGVVTQRCLEILEEIARKPFPDFVWLYIAQRHKNLHAWNE